MGAAQQVVLTMSLWCLHAGKLFGWLRSERLLLPWPGWWIQWSGSGQSLAFSPSLLLTGQMQTFGRFQQTRTNPVSSDHHFICNLQEWKFVLARADFNTLMKSWNVAAPSCNAFLSLFFLLLNVSDNEWQSENIDILCFFFWDKKTNRNSQKLPSYCSLVWDGVVQCKISCQKVEKMTMRHTVCQTNFVIFPRENPHKQFARTVATMTNSSGIGL